MRQLSVILAALAFLLVPVTTATPSGGFGGDTGTFGYGKDVAFGRAVRYCDAFRDAGPLRACLTRQLTKLVVSSRDSADELPRIDADVARQGGFLAANCHLIMHAVGRQYAASVHLTVGRLLDYLPRSNNANCSAGFGHGLLIYLAPQIGSLSPAEAAKACDGSPTRYQRYSCTHGFGHAYMRLYGEQLPYALHACRLLGPESAADCAAGAFHDYWIAVSGLDNTRHLTASMTTSPRKLCATEAGGFVRGCWYRALLEHPPERPVTTARDVLRTCRGLAGLQHESCVTAAVVVSADDPFSQMGICVALRTMEAADCARGVRVPDLAQVPGSERIRLIRRCANVFHPAQHACYGWMGKALNVVTNGKFESLGCPALRYAATRAACLAGARAYEGPLVTFS
jgi:hypothetical protein